MHMMRVFYFYIYACSPLRDGLRCFKMIRRVPEDHYKRLYPKDNKIARIWSPPVRHRYVHEVKVEGGIRLMCGGGRADLSCLDGFNKGGLCRHELRMTNNCFSQADIHIHWHMAYMLGQYDKLLFQDRPCLPRRWGLTSGILVLPSYTLYDLVEPEEKAGGMDVEELDFGADMDVADDVPVTIVDPDTVQAEKKRFVDFKSSLEEATASFQLAQVNKEVADKIVEAAARFELEVKVCTWLLYK